MKKNFLCVIGLACMAVACNSAIEQPVQYGEISVALGEPDVEVLTKADTPLSPEEAADYMIRLYDSADNKKHEALYSAFGTQTLALGTYYVTAENCSEAAAESANEGKGRMRLYGRSGDVVLTAENLSQTATVECSVANARVAVVFDSSVEGKFSDDLEVVLTGTSGRSVTVAQTSSEVETWFNPQNLNYTISGTFTQLDRKITIANAEPIVLSAKSNIKLVVKLSTSNGQLLIPEIQVNTDINDPAEVPGEFTPYN